MATKASSMTLAQAAEQSVPLAQLMAQVRESAARLASIEPLLPAGLRLAVQAGPIDANVWVLLVSNSAAAAKLRQLLPALESRLAQAGWQGSVIRLKVQASAR